MAKNVILDRDDPHGARPASPAGLDGYKRLALGVVITAIRELHDPDPLTATDALCFILDDTRLGCAGWLDACGDLGGGDPAVVLRRAINGKKSILKEATVGAG